MPLEPLPLGSKDINDEKKGERSDSVPVGSEVRWRVPLYQGSHELVRGGSGGLGRLPADRILEYESFQTTLYHGEGRSAGTSQENKPLGRENSRVNHLETNAVSSCISSRHCDMNVQRSVNVVLTYSSHPHSDIVNSRDQLHFKDQPDKTGIINGLSMHQSSEAPDAVNSLCSIDRRPLKWNRSGNLSSRGPGFSHSSSPKSIAAEILETKTDLQPRNVATIQSPSRDATPRATSTSLSEETSSRKKQRLGWGEGLAKYEKKKVESPDGSLSKNPDFFHSIGMNLAQKSPRVTGFSDCSSPATPSSVACSSSPGVGEKLFLKAISVATDPLSDSPGSVFQTHLEKHLINLEKLELKSIANLSNSIVELLQSDDMSIMGSSVARSAATNKLLTWKDDILKAVEITDSEIDQLENELKLLSSKSESCCPHKAVSTSPNSADKANPSGKQIATPDMTSRSSEFQFFSGNVLVETKNIDGDAPKDVNVATKEDDTDSPGTVTSKFVDQVGCVASSFAIETDILYDILSSNKDLANESAKTFNKFLPKKQCFVDISEACKNDCLQNDVLVAQKFMVKKRFLRFKERIASLKYRILLHTWKEDLHILSTKKYHSKTQKKIELSSRTPHIGFQRSRSSVRSQSICSWNRPAPSKEINNFVCKMLVDNQVKQCRDTLKMPALIMDDREKLWRFASKNGLVADPCAAESERAMINPWTPEEKATFIDKLSVLGKDFKKIAAFLHHKTIADCVEFYYKNHKSDCFSKAKKHPCHRKRAKNFPTRTYLLTSGKTPNLRDPNAASSSLGMLGEASVFAARNETPSTSFDGSDDKEAAADVLAGMGIRSSDTITSSFDVDYDDDDEDGDDECSDRSCGEVDPSDWRDDEKSVFLECLSSHGRDFKAISLRLGTRSREDCKIFFSKARKCLGLDRICELRLVSGSAKMDVDSTHDMTRENPPGKPGFGVRDSLIKKAFGGGDSDHFLRKCKSDEETRILSPVNASGSRGLENGTTGNEKLESGALVGNKERSNGVKERSGRNGSAKGLRMRYEVLMGEDGGG